MEEKIAPDGGVEVVELDWNEYARRDIEGPLFDKSNSKFGDDSSESSLKLDANWSPDVIIGCDIVFDKDVVPCLTDLLRHFLVLSKKTSPVEGPSPVAYIASTIRNPETYQLFLDCLVQRGLSFNVVSTFDATSSTTPLRYLEACNDENPRVEIISIRGQR